MDACACIIECEGEPFIYFRNSFPVARKEHTCIECGKVIKAGEKYENAFGIFRDGGKRAESYKTCMGCYNLSRHLMCGCRCYGMLAEDIYYALEIDITVDNLLGGTHE